MRRITLILAILISSALIFALGKLVPWASALFILLLIMFTYMIIINVLLFIDDMLPSRKKTPQWQGDEQGWPHISIIIPAHNEGSVITQLVEQLFALQYPSFDVLVMDDRSTDDTPQVLAQLAKTYADKPFRYVSRDPMVTPGKSAVLNDALSLVRGELIAIFDADAQVMPTFFDELVPALMDDDLVGGVQARKVIGNTKQGILADCTNDEYMLDALIQYGRDRIGGGVEFRGNGMLVKRKAVETVGGWNEASITDDLDLSTRLHMAGLEIRFVPTTTVIEEGIIKPLPLLRQRRRWTQGALERYLDYAPKILFSGAGDWTLKIDVVAYIIEFLYPMWVVMDHVYTVGQLIWGEPYSLHTWTTFMLLPLLGVFFAGLFAAALIRFDTTLQWWQLPYRMLRSTLYMVVTWVPMTVYVMGKMAMRKDQGFDWGKTEHYGLSAS